jgi:YD repeat-containing protein
VRKAFDARRALTVRTGFRTPLWVLIFLLSLWSSAHGETVYYRSNALAMPLEALAGGKPTGRGYEIAVERSSGREVRLLYRDGEEVERRERYFGPDGHLTEQKLFAGQTISSHFFYDALERAVQERLYQGGVLEKRVEYTYGPDALLSSAAYDADGAPVYTESYAYAGSGLLREVVRRYADGSLAIYSYGFADKLLVEERLGREEEVVISHYDAAGRPTEWGYYRDGELLEKKQWTYYGETGGLRTQVETDLAGDVTTRTDYDEQGRLVAEEQSGSVVSETVVSRDAEGRLDARTTTGREGKEDWRYTYDEAGLLLREDYYSKGRLEKSRVYTAEDTWYEEIYRQGEIFLRVYYENDRKVKEEFLSGGKVARERLYP